MQIPTTQIGIIGLAVMGLSLIHILLRLVKRSMWRISIHKALASLDYAPMWSFAFTYRFQSTRLSRASTSGQKPCTYKVKDFNPQGSREPRRQKCTIILASMPHLHASYYTSSTNRLSS